MNKMFKIQQIPSAQQIFMDLRILIMNAMNN